MAFWKKQEQPPKETWEKPGPDTRQQGKIVGVLEEGKSFRDREYAPTYHTRERALRKIASGEISTTKIKEEVSRINTNIRYLDVEDIEKSERATHMKGMIWLLAQGENYNPKTYAEDREKVGTTEMLEVATQYENPWEMSRALDSFLDRIERHNGTAKMKQYEEAREELLATIYGKRYQYWVQAQYLVREARTKYPNEERRDRSRSTKRESYETKNHARDEKEKTPQAKIEKSEIGNKSKAEVAQTRRFIRNQGKIPLSIPLPDESYAIYQFENRDYSEGELKALAGQAAELVHQHNENDPEFMGSKNKKMQKYHRAVSADFNDATDLIHEGVPTRENKIRSELLRIFMSEIN